MCLQPSDAKTNFGVFWLNHYNIISSGNGLVPNRWHAITWMITQKYDLHGIAHPQWVNSLWGSNTIWQIWSESTLAQVMACCLTTPSHYLNQCWLITISIQLRTIPPEMLKIWSTKLCVRLKHLKFQPHLPGGQWVKLCRANTSR